MKQKAVAVFISGHGYGHVSRMKHVVRALNCNSGENYKILVFSDCNPLFFKGKDFCYTECISLSHDVGLIQFDSINVDLQGTLKKLYEFFQKKNELIIKISDILKPFNTTLILSDTSSVPFLIAGKFKIPSCFIGNFTWSDIYRDLSNIEPVFRNYIPILNEEYSYAEKAFVLPVNTVMEPFAKTKIENIPFICPEKSRMSEREWEGITGQNYDRNKKYILLSFGGFDLKTLPEANIESFGPEFVFIATRAKGNTPIKNLIQIDPMCSNYSGLIKFSDVVITKPGYGIIADCLVEQKPIIFTERGRFAEYEILKNWLLELYPSVYMPNSDFLEGNWLKYIQKTLKIPKNYPDVLKNGAEIILNETKLIKKS